MTNDVLLTCLLDKVHASMASRDFISGVRELGLPLTTVYRQAKAAGQDLTEVVRKHPVYSVCHEDPLTSRAYRKPRGYAGDAVMLDYVYYGKATEPVNEAGQGIFRCTTRTSTALSLLYRRDLIRAYINDVVATVPHYRILSVACGHCRELESSLALADGMPGEFVALDQDDESLAEVRRQYPSPKITLVRARIEQLMQGAVDMGKFDFVYSAGLYDYLPVAVARLLTQKLLALVNPGGRLLIANLAQTTAHEGYMSLFMDWKLIHRSEAQIREFFPTDQGADAAVTLDPHGNVWYALLRIPG